MRGLGALMLVAVMVTPVSAGDPVARTYLAGFDRVWVAVENALTAEGWGVDAAARPLGRVVTKTERLAGRDAGLQAITLRVRLHLTLTPSAADRTRVEVQREVIGRERVLWVERDTHAAVADALGGHGVEQRILTAIGHQLWDSRPFTP